MAVTYQWRGAFTNAEVNALHTEAFETAVLDESDWNWAELSPPPQPRLGGGPRHRRPGGFTPAKAGLITLA